MATSSSFGDLLRQYRIAAGVTQEALADQAGLSLRGLSDLERGARRAPYPDTVRRLADSLALSGAEHSAFFSAGGRVALRRLASAAIQPASVVLPVPLSTFVGREHELMEVRRVLETNRLVTLTGPGGIGKTRLALRVATDLVETFPNGISWVELASLADPRLVVQTVASALHVHDEAGRSLLDSLVDTVRRGLQLLILDNCEHVVEACASLVDSLLRGCPHLSLVMTSREALGVPGEVVWPVPPLLVPGLESPIDPERLLQCEAVRLFVDRATAARPGFALGSHNAPAVAQICQRLDGIPLAIELAARRAKVLSAEQIADHLVDRFALLTSGPRTTPARHQTLSAAVGWSYDLLDPTERTLFDRLSVFAGGWTLEAAEAICEDASPGVRQEKVLDRLTRLIDSSLVIVEERAGAARYGQLETLRAYGCGRLEACADAACVRDRHAAWYLALAEQDGPGASCAPSAAWVWQLDSEQDNLRAALAWFSDHDVARGLRLAVAVAPFWYLRSNVSESSLHLQKLLARMPDRNALRALALFQLARLLELRRAVAPARSHAEESLAIWRELADGRGIAQTLGLLGVLAEMEADFERGRTLYEEALGHARELDDSGLIIESLQHLGALAITKRQFRLAWQFFDESRARSRETNSSVYLLNSLGRLGVVARLEGDYATARRLLEQALALAREVGHHAASCAYLTGLGNLARCENDAMTARAHLEAALCLARGDSGMALVMYACLASFGALAIQQGTDLRGVRLIAAAAAGDTALGAPHIPEVRVDAEASLVSAHTAVGPHAFATAWAEGQAMTLDEAITYALTETEPVSGPAERLIADSRQHPLPANTGQLRGTTAADRRLTLTLRQREVAALVAQGRTNRQIGEALVITEGTARVHVEHILAKLGLHSRAQLAGWAVARGLFAPSI